MDFRFTLEDQALQKEAIRFVRHEWDPTAYDMEPEIRTWHHADPDCEAAVKVFEKKLVRKGWWTMHWPKAFGGEEAPITTQLAYREAMAYAGAPAALGGGLVAPILMAHGQDWQKEYFLPKIASADIDFSQGFSEPNAGSDLASLQTRAVRDGDDYVINGQKIWGTYRHPWIHMLVRTDLAAPKHRGISYLLMPLLDERSNYLPGITVRPIPEALGRHGWDEMFLEDVRVPARNLIGEENRGWYAAMTTLSFERSYVWFPASLTRILEDYIAFCRERKRANGESPMDAAIVRNTLANVRVELEAMRTLCYRVAWLQGQGQVPQREPSQTKVWGATLTQTLYRFLSRTLSEYGNLLPGSRFPLPVTGYLNSRAYQTVIISITAGTSEVQRNIIAQRGLGLPR